MRPQVAVVVPARDEATSIVGCVLAIRRSLAVAALAGAIDRATIVVVAHRCTDLTAALARMALVGIAHDVIEDDRSTTVGEVRRLGVGVALRRLQVEPRPAVAARTWILNTDADSRVGPSWVSDILRYGPAGNVAVVGMTSLRGALRSAAAREAYRQIIEAGVSGAEHDHVYGANLAVRADAYAAVGGFRGVPLGEDRVLVDALRAHGLPVARPRDLVVATSARRTGRAVGGLADLLADLDRTPDAAAGDGAATKAHEHRRSPTPVGDAQLYSPATRLLALPAGGEGSGGGEYQGPRR